MKKIVVSMMAITLLVLLAACGSGTDKGSEQPEVTENAGASFEAAKDNDTELQVSGKSETETEENNGQFAADMDTDLTDEETGAADTATDLEHIEDEIGYMEGNTMKITAGDTTFTVTLVNNSSVEALKEILAEGPLTINMSDYAGMEKVGSIGTNLPRNDEQISTVAGDIILYQGSSLVIYYDTNTWDFTRIGKIEDVTGEELLEAFGDGDVTVTFSLE